METKKGLKCPGLGVLCKPGSVSGLHPNPNLYSIKLQGGVLQNFFYSIILKSIFLKSTIVRYLLNDDHENCPKDDDHEERLEVQGLAI